MVTTLFLAVISDYESFDMETTAGRQLHRFLYVLVFHLTYFGLVTAHVRCRPPTMTGPLPPLVEDCSILALQLDGISGNYQPRVFNTMAAATPEAIIVPKCVAYDTCNLYFALAEGSEHEVSTTHEIAMEVLLLIQICLQGGIQGHFVGGKGSVGIGGSLMMGMYGLPGLDSNSTEGQKIHRGDAGEDSWPGPTGHEGMKCEEIERAFAHANSTSVTTGDIETL